MRTIRQNKMIKIGILVLVIGGLTIGFATFSNNLNIRSSTTVSPDPDNFKIVASASREDKDILTITPTVNRQELLNNAGTATISNAKNNFSITGLHATLTKPGDRVTYTFYAHNIGIYKAYIGVFRHTNIGDTGKVRICTARDGATESLVQEACKNIHLVYCLRDYESNVCHRAIAEENVITYNGSPHNFELPIGDATEISFYIEYDYNSKYSLADGPFDVELGDIRIEFNSTK